MRKIKKLNFRKETIRTLASSELVNVPGGQEASITTLSAFCKSAFYTDCCVNLTTTCSA